MKPTLVGSPWPTSAGTHTSTPATTHDVNATLLVLRTMLTILSTRYSTLARAAPVRPVAPWLQGSTVHPTDRLVRRYRCHIPSVIRQSAQRSRSGSSPC